MTEIDPPRSNDMDGGWVGRGNCGPECPIEADAWRDDDNTFIVKYSDVETWQMTAILTMICTGGCLLIIGLLISLIVIFFGKIDFFNLSIY